MFVESQYIGVDYIHKQLFCFTVSDSYLQTSNISGTLIGDIHADHSESSFLN